MAESIKGMKRSALCTEINESMLGQELTLMGWAHKQRDLGGVIFITLRDRSGEVQLLVDDQSPADVREKAARVRSEYVLAVRGRLHERQSANPNMKTGAWELHLDELRIVSEAKTPPFYIEEESDAREALRLKHRYLDLRRPDLQRNIIMRSQLTQIARRYFDAHGFVDIETPMLGKSTPEGARDYLVPSRVHPGHFFALPQSPQLYKQLLMVAGFDRYIQIARCFRDEDLRADRQPEFTQIDLELSFADEDEIMSVVEGFVAKAISELKGQTIELPLRRMPYEEAMRRYGSDKPDLRFGMELQDVSDFAKQSDFPLFQQTIADGGQVIAIVVPNGGSLSRKEIDALGEYVKTYRLKGLPWIAPSDEKSRGSIMKFLTEEEIQALCESIGAATGDLILFGSDESERVLNGMGMLRCEVAKRLDMIDEQRNELLWVTEFPLFEYSEEEDRLVAKHHPFTSPLEEDRDLLGSEPAKVRARAYDIVMNGVELGGGSVRIHDQALQEEMFSLLGFTQEEAYENFSFLLDAFQYGVPPHGGCALGLDRLVMLLCAADSLREVIAFPKVQTSADLMTQAPGLVSQKQLDELQLDLQAVEVEELLSEDK